MIRRWHVYGTAGVVLLGSGCFLGLIAYVSGRPWTHGIGINAPTPLLGWFLLRTWPGWLGAIVMLAGAIYLLRVARWDYLAERSPSARRRRAVRRGAYALSALTIGLGMWVLTADVPSGLHRCAASARPAISAQPCGDVVLPCGSILDPAASRPPARSNNPRDFFWDSYCDSLHGPRRVGAIALLTAGTLLGSLTFGAAARAREPRDTGDLHSSRPRSR